MTFQDFQKTIISRCHKAGACKPEFKRLIEASDRGDKAGFVRVLIENHGWCIGRVVYDAELFLALDEQDVLLESGLPTQLNQPIEFQVEEIGGRLWKPFNEGGTAENGVGDYMTFDEANDPQAGRIVPSVEDFQKLCALPSVWALYQGQFGRLFDGRLFIPAAGYRHRDSGTLYAVGSNGYSWSSSIPAGSTNAHYLSFYYSWIYPQNSVSRAYGFQVRCLQE